MFIPKQFYYMCCWKNNAVWGVTWSDTLYIYVYISIYIFVYIYIYTHTKEKELSNIYVNVYKEKNKSLNVPYGMLYARKIQA